MPASTRSDGSERAQPLAQPETWMLPSDLVLAGKAGAYRLIRKATTRGPVQRMIGVDEFETLFGGTQDG